jgi:hypothetical protein
MACFNGAVDDFGSGHQGCQIFLDATYQNGENMPNEHTKNGHKMHPNAGELTEWP